MTTWVSMTRTGRGADSNRIDIAAGNGLPAWTSLPSLTPPVARVDSGDDWIATRWIAAVAWLNRWPEADSGPLTRFDSTRDTEAGSSEVVNVATVAVGHWGLETGWGTNEWDWNLGGIHCGPESDSCFREADSAGGEEFQAFDTFADFATAYFELISRTYPSAWEAMKAGSANALLRLWRDNYACGGKTRQEATDLCQRVRRVVRHEITNAAAALPTEGAIAATEANVPNRCTPTSRNRGTPSSGGGGSGTSSRNTLIVGGALALAALAMMKDRR